MIIGHGDIATALRDIDSDSRLYFASGVSNSQEKRESEYEREIRLLQEQSQKQHIVYFSSLCVFYSQSRYAEHKKLMEGIIRIRFKHYTIVRLGNITWGDNPHTIINFIRNKIKKNEPFEIHKEYRYIIDKDEFLHWMKMIPPWNCEMNLTGIRMTVKQIVNKYGYVNLHS